MIKALIWAIRKLLAYKQVTDDKDAVNVSQLKKVEEVANKGWNLTANGARFF